MKTSITITIEHPDDTSADGLINLAIASVIDDINSDVEDGWKVHIDDVCNDVSVLKNLISKIDPNSEVGQFMGTSLVHFIQSHFQFVGNIWYREDAEGILNRPLTDEEWDKVYSTNSWMSLGRASDVDYLAIEEALDEAEVEVF